MTPARNPDAIAQRAYAIWEEEGRPTGRDQAHWDQAEQEISGAAPAQAEAAESAAESPARARRPAMAGEASPPKPARGRKAMPDGAPPAPDGAAAPKRSRAKAPAS